MSRGDDTNGWVGEDEMLLADAEGPESARADAAFGQAKRRDAALQRRGQLERIREVFELGDGEAYEDARIRTFYRVIGYVHEQKWREAMDDLRRETLVGERPEQREWREQQRADTFGPERVHQTTFNDGALFLPDREAIRGMTHRLKDAIEGANEYLRIEHPGMVAEKQFTYPNPYQDLWVIDPIDPSRRGERIDGGSLIVVPAVGQVYPAGSGAEPRPPEVIGMIGPPDLEWDDLSGT